MFSSCSAACLSQALFGVTPFEGTERAFIVLSIFHNLMPFLSNPVRQAVLPFYIWRN